MNLEDKIIKFVDFKVKPIKKEDNGEYGFVIELIKPDGTVVIQEKSGYLQEAEAQDARDEVVGKLYAGQYVAYDDISVETFISYWLEKVMRRKITADSYDTYKNVVYNHIIPAIGKLNLNSIQMSHIQKLYDETNELYPSVARLVKVVINTSFRYAKKNRLMNNNPAENVKFTKKSKQQGYRTRNIDSKKTLTLEQIKVLLEKSKDTPIHMQVLFAVLMGLRRSEINGLKYSDIDYINQTLRIERQLGKKANTKRTEFAPKTFTKQEIKLKTESSYRILPIPDYVFQEILEQRKKYEANRRRRKKDFKDLDYICCSSYGNPRSKSYHFPHYKKLLLDNGLPNIRFHDLRTSFCTLLIKNDYSLKAISQMMGHAKEIITVDVYGDNKQIIADCTEELQAFIDDVQPEKEEQYKDQTDVVIDIEAYL